MINPGTKLEPFEEGSQLGIESTCLVKGSDTVFREV